jgi:para-aminobenzoate synthetase component 1
LRKSHPAPFAAFINRDSDFVVSISPERFLKVQSPKSKAQSQAISTSPIKGTRPRGKNETEDLFRRNQLLSSEKDGAEYVMIVDLLRNDIGRICEFGCVSVEKLCALETHPTLFHLVSTVSGKLLKDVNLMDIIKAVFPCGSITGAPKIRTMQIIDELETAQRGLSMGAIGYFLMENGKWKMENKIDMNVAIRTMVIRGCEAVFNVGGGIVIDSDAEDEYAESLVKAKALLKAIN